MADAVAYEIRGVVGRGGVGVVYAAREVDGLQRDVAVKLLKDGAATEETMQRFRDEARLLAMVRDRALVRAEPPCRFEGGWAIVMDLVDGLDLRSLVEEHGPLPPRAALEVVAEIARALDRVWRQKGPGGKPLQVLHRDLKPANLLLTADGQVHLLDLGIAKADFAEREARTAKVFMGTPGFIAPERLIGDDGPKGDIYSLGVVLNVLVTGKRAGGDAGDIGPLIADMCASDPKDRPSARDVMQRCDALDGQLAGEGLRAWASPRVSPRPLDLDDPLVGQVVEIEGPRGSASGLRGLLAAVALVAAAFAASAVVLVAMALTWAWLR